MYSIMHITTDQHRYSATNELHYKLQYTTSGKNGSPKHVKITMNIK